MSNAWSYFAGQCTAFVASVLSWVPAHWGNANQWFPNAAAQGYSEGQTPAVGAIADWSGLLPGSGGAGHVADVTQVNPDGSFVVQEENYSGGPGVEDTRTVPAGGGGDFLGFIYGPPGTAAPSGGNGLSLPNPLSGAASDLQGAVSAGVNSALDSWVQGGLQAVSQGASNTGQDVGAFVNNNLIALGVAGAVVAVLMWRMEEDG